MFRYFILHTMQQLFCYLYGIVFALSLMLLFPPDSRTNGFYLVALSVALFWAGLALYIRHTDQMRMLEVSPLVSIRDGIQVVATLPRHEKAQLEWEVLHDDEVYRQQMHNLISLVLQVTSRGMIYAPAIMLSCVLFFAWVIPHDVVGQVTSLREMPAEILVCQTGYILRYMLLISIISVLITDVLCGRLPPNVFRRALLDRLPAEAWRIRRGTER